MVRVFIDPGHGGADPGAVANGLQEKDICLSISLMLRNILVREYTGIFVKLSRTTDRTLTLNERTNMANQWHADLLISVHVNAGGGAGFESFIYCGTYANKGRTDRWRGLLHDEIVQGSMLRDRGRKQANFHMLRESRMPAVLTENGFIDTMEDAKKLKNTTFLEQIAHAHAVGVVRIFGLKKKNVPTSIPGGPQVNQYHIIKKGDTLWSLAGRYNTTVQQLLQWNQPIVSEHLQIGRKIKVG